ncbi:MULTISPECIES: glycosyltransferase [Grimontia]|uniref:glycosyltransferase n=1 Tax=Grimontia TaxID=246861 RepID=UPI001EF9DEEF|nr:MULTISPECIES: glycosyltransferase [Grimontia]
MVFVNDGSKDNTLAVLKDMAPLDKRVKLLNLSRNFGKEAALTAVHLPFNEATHR